MMNLKKRFVSVVTLLAVLIASISTGMVMTAFAANEGEFYYNSFDGTEGDSRIKLVTQDGAFVGIKNGAMMIETTESYNTSNQVGVEFYTNTDLATAISTGELVTEFEVTRSSNCEDVFINLLGSNGRNFTAVTWSNKQAANVIYYSDTKGTDNTTPVTHARSLVHASATSVKFTFYQNFDNQTFSLWMDDILICDDKYAMLSATTDLRKVYIYTKKRNASISIDNFRYSVESKPNKPVVPAEGDLIYTDTFNNTLLNTRVVPIERDEATIAVSDGQLRVTTTDNYNNSNQIGVELYPYADKTVNYTGDELVTVINLERQTDRRPVFVDFYGKSGKHFTSIQWSRESDSGIYYSDAKGVEDRSMKVNNVTKAIGAANSLKIVLYQNIKNQTFDLWLNDSLAAHDKYPMYPTENGLSKTYIYYKRASCWFGINDFKYYAPATKADLKLPYTYDYDNGYYYGYGNITADVLLSKAVLAEGASAVVYENDGVTPVDGQDKVLEGMKIKVTSPDGSLSKTYALGWGEEYVEYAPVVSFADGKFNAEFCVDSNVSGAKSYICIVACYTGNKLSGVDVRHINVSEAKTYSVTASAECTAQAGEEYCAYLLGANLKPIKKTIGNP